MEHWERQAMKVGQGLAALQRPAVRQLPSRSVLIVNGVLALTVPQATDVGSFGSTADVLVEQHVSCVCVCVSSVAPDQIDQETLMDSLQASLAKMHVILHIPVL